MNFKDGQNNLVSISDILTSIEDISKFQLFIGTDSQIKKKERKVVYATCVVLYKIGKGGRVFTSRHKTKIPNSLKERLAAEVWRSLEVAIALSGAGIDPKMNVVIHVDVNKSTKFKSGNYQQELVSMVVGQGFKCQIKPDSFVASTVADRFAKREDI